MTPPTDHITRRRILDAAFQLFHEQGYNATSVATILREADVAAGSLYHFFPSKEELLLGVLEHALGLLRPRVMDPAEAATTDPIGRVFALMQGYRALMASTGCKMGCPIGNLALEVADDNAKARALIQRNFENWAGVVKSWLDAAPGRIPRDADTAALSRFVLTVMEGGLMQARAARSLVPFDECVEQMRRYFWLLEERAASEDRGEGRTKLFEPSAPGVPPAPPIGVPT